MARRLVDRIVALRAYGYALGTVVLIATLQAAIYPWVGPRVPFLFYAPALVITASTLGLGPSLLVLAAGALSEMLMAAPTGSLAITGVEDRIVLALYLVVGTVLVLVGSRQRLVSQRALETERRLKMAQLGTGIGFYELDFAANVATVSPSLCELLEKPIQQGPIPLDRWLGILSSDLVEDTRHNIERRLAEGVLQYDRELQFQLSDGSTRWIMSRIYLDATPSGELQRARGASVDITARKRADLLLQQTRAQLLQQVEDLNALHQCSTRLLSIVELPEQLATILDSLIQMHAGCKGFVSLRDPADGGVRFVAQRQFSEANLQSLLAQVAADPVVQGAWAQRQRLIVGDLDSDPAMTAYRDFARAEQIRALHSTPMVSSAGDVLGMLTVHFPEPRVPDEREMRLADICAQKAAVFIERARARDTAIANEQRFRVALESSAVPFAIMTPVRDTLDHIVDFRVEYINTSGAGTFGGSVTESLGQRMSEVLPVSTRHDVLLQQFRSVVEGQQSLQFELQSAADSWFHVVASPLQLKVAVWFADITERKRHEQQLKEADRRKDEFLATLAHELRNPLAPIRHAAAILRAPDISPDQKLHSLQIIDRQASHMALLLDDLLDLPRITRGTLRLRLRRIELADVVATAIEAARPLIDAKRHRLTTELPAEPVSLDADPLRLAQIIGNVLTNAAKYTDPGGRIRLSAAREGDRLTIEIADNGIGIQADRLQDIFGMFSQVTDTDSDRSAGGIGIGLALARGLVELHGGSIEAHSAGPGLGSRFVIRLQSAAAVSQASPPPPERSPPPVRAGTALRILIADDNADAAEALDLLLRFDGHEVRVVNDGDAALAALLQDRFDIGLLDIGMPKRSGIDVARAIHAHPGACRPRLIALSGWGTENDKHRSQEAGFDHHLIKPVEFEQLRRLLHPTS